MSGDGRCLHEMLPGQCSIGQGLPDDALYATVAGGEPGYRARLASRPARARTAEHDSRCPRCREWIAAGDTIVKDEGAEWWLCEGCHGLEL